VLERSVGVGQICLKHDARLVVVELRSIEQHGERGHRHVEVAELLHVEVDEHLRRGRRCRAEERRKTIDHARDRRVERETLQLTRNRGNLHRHVVDIRAPNHHEHRLRSTGRLGLTQHVDVGAYAAGTSTAEMAAQPTGVSRKDHPG
jgi:hypothetical protein